MNLFPYWFSLTPNFLETLHFNFPPHVIAAIQREISRLDNSLKNCTLNSLTTTRRREYTDDRFYGFNRISAFTLMRSLFSDENFKKNATCNFFHPFRANNLVNGQANQNSPVASELSGLYFYYIMFIDRSSRVN